MRLQYKKGTTSFLGQIKLESISTTICSPRKLFRRGQNITRKSLPPTEREALKVSKGNEQINLRKADKGTNTVVMTKEEKLNEGQLQLQASRVTHGRGNRKTSSKFDKRATSSEFH